MEAFLATVEKVYINSDQFLSFPKNGNNINDYVIVYGSKDFSDTDNRFLGAIEFRREGLDVNENFDYAFPFDKNNLTYPIEGETVFIIKSVNEYYWLPYTVTQYPNYREDYKTSVSSTPINLDTNNSKQANYNEINSMGITNNKSNISQTQKKKYIVKEKIKFLKPKPGDTILQGRVGNTIRFSEAFLLPEENAKDAAPSIIIRNRQSEDATNKKIGELVEEDINKDGSSIYIVSKDIKIPYNHTTIQKEKKAFKDYPKDADFKGDRIFLNSDQVLLASKAREFIIFGKGNTGIITDGRFSVDAEKDIHLHTNSNITIQSGPNNQIVLDKGPGEVYIGKKQKPGPAGSEVQKMVMGGELVGILGQIIDQIVIMTMATSCGPSSPPINASAFTAIKGQLNTILSGNNFLSKT